MPNYFAQLGNREGTEKILHNEHQTNVSSEVTEHTRTFLIWFHPDFYW